MKQQQWRQLTCIKCGNRQWTRIIDGNQETLLNAVPKKSKEALPDRVTSEYCVRIIEAYQQSPDDPPLNVQYYKPSELAEAAMQAAETLRRRLESQRETQG
jgi:hypothetical protein